MLDIYSFSACFYIDYFKGGFKRSSQHQFSECTLLYTVCSHNVQDLISVAPPTPFIHQSSLAEVCLFMES